jgi:hypothetical protein
LRSLVIDFLERIHFGSNSGIEPEPVLRSSPAGPRFVRGFTIFVVRIFHVQAAASLTDVLE